ncbi:LVIVD repeat-containing protein [Aquiflexum sp.]|uniref:LVIVD repeat-containing protein n=1 Tax=Aquiflexum sp. TaxID=1872584 RepID=UPI0035940A54
MKTTLLPLISRPLNLVLALMMFLVLPSCHDEVSSTVTYRTSIPVYLEMSTVRTSDIIIESGRELDNPGKIYIYGDFLFVNEPNKGIHILDNSNPASPVNINFINIPGNVDLAVNTDILYADSYVDLLAFDISDPRNIKKVNRVEDVFMHMYSNHATNTIITWKDTVMTSDSDMMFGWRGRWGGMWMVQSADASFRGNSGGAQSYGQGGSMARFTLMSGHLYAVDDYSLRVFDVMQEDDPKHLKNIDLGWGIETIFPFKDKLFIGSNTGMHIYDASNPSDPKVMSVYQHITACDPVVVNDVHAFVTLRSGMFCRMGVDELQVVDITDLYRPTLVKAYPMLNPHGLALAGDYLYVAEGKHGLKSFNVADVFNIDKNQLEFLKSMKSVDIIPGPKSLIVIGPDGVCQFDYSTPSVLKPLSCIQVKNPVIV